MVVALLDSPDCSIPALIENGKYAIYWAQDKKGREMNGYEYN